MKKIIYVALCLYVGNIMPSAEPGAGVHLGKKQAETLAQAFNKLSAAISQFEGDRPWEATKFVKKDGELTVQAIRFMKSMADAFEAAVIANAQNAGFDVQISNTGDRDSKIIIIK